MKLHDMFYTIHLLIIIIIQLNKKLYDTFELFIIQMKSFFFECIVGRQFGYLDYNYIVTK